MSRMRIPQRTRIYLGCEGPSEQSYGRLLITIADAAGLHLHIDNDVLQPGGGDPLALVRLSIRRIEQKERQRGGFTFRALLLDRDRVGQSPERDGQVERLAAANDVLLIWQDPCHEGFLLRHLEGNETARPMTSELAMQALRRVWPEYEKGIPASQLARRIDIAGVLRTRLKEQAFADFLERIGLH
jgi:hypothetical protein